MSPRLRHLARHPARPSPVRAAIIGLLTAGLVVALALNLNNLPVIGAGPTYRADFSDAAGLQVGEEVRIAGVKVSDVSAITLAGAHVVVAFRVKHQRLGRDTRASIEIKTLLGQHFLAVAPLGPGTLPAGTEIPLDRTTTPVQIVPTVQQLSLRVDALDTDRLAAAFDTLATTLHATAPEVRPALDGLTALSRVIASRDAQVQQLFARARDVTGTVAARDTQIRELINASNQVLEVLDERHTDIHNLLLGTRQLATQLRGLIADNRAQLRPALDHLNTVIDILHRNDTNIDTVLTQLPVFLRLLTNATGNGRWFGANITAPRDAAVCDPDPTGPLAPLVDPLLTQANRAANRANAPCLPLGPAASTPPATTGGTR
jgi:phospholipid/cholesterol/gamma-HCH transport system substrate-binding protein